MKIIISSLTSLTTLFACTSSIQAETIRYQAQRLRNPNSNTVATKTVTAATIISTEELYEDGSVVDIAYDENNHLNYIIDAFATLEQFSMQTGVTNSPSDASETTDAPSSSVASTSFPTTNGVTASTEPVSGLVTTAAPVNVAVVSPSDAPTNAPSSIAVDALDNTPSPTTPGPVGVCPGITDSEREQQILDILDAAANPNEIRDFTTPQGQATEWLLLQDQLLLCPDHEKILQRWATAVVYYSTGGDDWFLCSADTTDNCGVQDPFSNGEFNFLSEVTECDWAGISCIDGCITEIEFEENNLAGTIPTEIALLTDLTIWGMERGTLTGTIPTEVGLLTNLIFIDLDFNQLVGTLSPELLGLSGLTQLDLNNNEFSGSVNDIGVFPDMQFLQLHDNNFTGTVPEAVGSFSNLTAFTLHESFISGTMPASVCDLLATSANGGVLTSLISDCANPNPSIECSCCTDCR